MTTARERTTDLYPTRGATEVTTPRQDPVVWSEPGAAGPIQPSELQAYERDGFLTVNPLIDPEEVTVYRAELDRLISDSDVRADERSIVEPKSQDVRSVFEVHKISEVFAGLVRDPR